MSNERLSPEQTDIVAKVLPPFRSSDEKIAQVGAGAFAGFLTTIILSPLDVIKTRLQVQSSTSLIKKSKKKTTTSSSFSTPRFAVTASSQNVVYQRTYEGLISAFASMYKNEGISSFYRGLNASLMALVPNWAIYWYVYEGLKVKLAQESSLSTIPINISSAVCAGALTGVITSPFWVIKTRMQVEIPTCNTKKYSTVFGSIRKMIAEEGFFSMYKGMTATFLGLSHVAIQFPLYEVFKSEILANGGELTTSSVTVASFVAKVIASSVTYPHEVVRSRLQVHEDKISTPVQGKHQSELYKTWQIMNKTWKVEGFRGFYNGFGVNLAKSLPNAVIMFTSYEFAKDKIYGICQLLK